MALRRRGGALSDAAEIVSTRGWTGLYAGLRPALLGTTVSQGVWVGEGGVVRRFRARGGRRGIAHVSLSRVSSPPPGVYFYLYSLLRDAAVRRAAARPGARKGAAGAPPPLSVPASLAVAFLAGCGNVLLTNPIWIIATRMQAAAKAAPPAGEADLAAGVPAPRSSALRTARQLFQEGGVPAFWRGVGPSLVMVANPTVNYMLYEVREGRERG